MPYLFSRANSPQRLIDRLEAFRWRGMIVGPHGSGKTTLLEALIPECRQRGRNLQRFTLRDRQRHLAWGASRTWHHRTLVIVDGYEQLAWWSRQWLRWCCMCKGSGLLVTAHHAGAFPVLYRTEPDLPLVQKLVDQLLGSHQGRITPTDVQAAVARHGQNVREVLFELYDVYQMRS